MEKKKMVFIGNSIVNGFPFKRSQCFVGLIRQESGHEVINKGNNGETTSDILARFQRDVIAHKPDLAFIMTGTNDFIYGEATPQQALGNLMKMAEMAGASDIRPVFLTPIPVDPVMASQRWMAGAGVNYADVNRQLDELASLLKSFGTDCIDLTSAYGRCGLYHDGVHPLPEGHRFIADIILAQLPQLLNEQR